jgi:hypothetical protein
MKNATKQRESQGKEIYAKSNHICFKEGISSINWSEEVKMC